MFSIVHLHLLLNHLPIIVTGLGLLLVALAVWRADDYLARVALWFLVGGAVSALNRWCSSARQRDMPLTRSGLAAPPVRRRDDRPE